MKKLITLLFVLFIIASVNAQNSYDTALQNNAVTTNNKFSDLYAQNSSTTITSEEFEPKVTKKELNVMPAKGSNNIQLVFNADNMNDATIAVIDLQGKTVLNQTAHLTAGKNNVLIENLTSLNEGNYTIQLTSNNTTYNSSFILWK